MVEWHVQLEPAAASVSAAAVIKLKLMENSCRLPPSSAKQCGQGGG